MCLNFRFAAALGLAAAMLLIGGKSASAQTITPVENPFHVVTGTTRSEGFTIQNTTSETILLDSFAATAPAQFGFMQGPDFFTKAITLTAGQVQTAADAFRFTATGVPGTTGVFTYQFAYRGLSTGNIYTLPQGSITLITDAPGTVPVVPEPSTAALMLPALGTFPLLKLRRRKRQTATA